jgi:predicted Rossmann fold flavoprotein
MIVMTHSEWDVAVIGGGASGLAAACAAGQAGAKTVILERADRVGRKLLATGNGKCNLSNAAANDLRCYFSETPDAVRQVLTRCPPEKVLQFFRSLGLLTRTDSEGRIYPYSEQASAVLDVLRTAAEVRGVAEACNFDVQQIRRTNGRFLLQSKTGESITARSVIVACGGPAAPANGGTDSGLNLLRSMGHPVTTLHPSLTPLKTDEKLTRPLKGLRVKCSVTLMQGSRAVASEQGELQLGEGQLSGICIFQLSRTAGALLAKGARDLFISVDLLPGYTPEETRALLNTRRSLRSCTADQYFTGLFAKKIGFELMRGIVSDPTKRTVGDLTATEIAALAKRCRDWRFPVLATGTYANAQVTAGGARLDSFDGAMQSKKVPGLFACGEVLDADGLCGGFNLQWAWSSGLLAGMSSAAYCGKGTKK